jgi:hypothetical protein
MHFYGLDVQSESPLDAVGDHHPVTQDKQEDNQLNGLHVMCSHQGGDSINHRSNNG